MDRAFAWSRMSRGSPLTAHMHPGAHSTSEEAPSQFSPFPALPHSLFSFKPPCLFPSSTSCQASLLFPIPISQELLLILPESPNDPPPCCLPHSPSRMSLRLPLSLESATQKWVGPHLGLTPPFWGLIQSKYVSNLL